MRVATSDNAGGHVPFVKDAAVLVVVVAPVCIHAAGSAQRPATQASDQHNGINERDRLCDVVTAGAGQDRPDRCAVRIRGDVVFGTGSRPIGGVRASFLPAPTARIDEESTTTREKSISSAARSFARSTACSRSHTLACCQSRSLRQQLTPEPHPISAGKSRQRIPVFSTNGIPVNAALSGTGLRQGYIKRRGFAGRKRGSISVHRLSSMIGLPISPPLLSRRSRLHL